MQIRYLTTGIVGFVHQHAVVAMGSDAHQIFDVLDEYLNDNIEIESRLKQNDKNLTSSSFTSQNTTHISGLSCF